MERPKLAAVNITCDCGDKRQIPFDGIYGDLHCPACGDISHFKPEEIAAIEVGFGRALQEAARLRDSGDPAPGAVFDLGGKRLD
jgi:hypothetical protein